MTASLSRSNEESEGAEKYNLTYQKYVHIVRKWILKCEIFDWAEIYFGDQTSYIEMKALERRLMSAKIVKLEMFFNQHPKCEEGVFKRESLSGHIVEQLETLPRLRISFSSLNHVRSEFIQ